MPIKKFTFFWKTGHREVFEGETARDAFAKAGYGMAALDWANRILAEEAKQIS